MDSGEKQKCSLFLYLENKFICAHWLTALSGAPARPHGFPTCSLPWPFCPDSSDIHYEPPEQMAGTSCILLAGAHFGSLGFSCVGPLSHLAAMALFLGYCLTLLASDYPLPVC